MNQSMTVLQLKKNEDKRLRVGHLWVYSNEIDTKATPIKSLNAGELVELHSQSGRVLGTAYANPQSLICARVISTRPNQVLDEDYFVQRFESALALRTRLYAQPYYRFVFAEADRLPGLVIDRYADTCVVQITTAGMELAKAEILVALQKVLNPVSVLWRNDSSARAQEGLSSYIDDALGQVPEKVTIEEAGVRYTVPLFTGQKTGWFYDQAANRLRFRDYVKDASVLDVFAYLGGWGVGAAVAGAKSVICVDASASAAQLISGNAADNNVAEKVEVMQGDAFEAMKQLRDQGKTFDVVNVDPPAFIKRKKDLKNGQQAYQRINELAMRLLADDGILVSSSCSHHLYDDVFLRLLNRAAEKTGRQLQILEQRYQSPDHPVHPAIQETRYLKCTILRVQKR